MIDVFPVMMSCAEREHERRATLTAWAGTDFEVEPYVVIDTGEGRPGPRRMLRTFYRAAIAGTNAGTEWVLVLEDDLRFNRHLHARLSEWEPAREARGGFFGSLYWHKLDLAEAPRRCATGPGDAHRGGQALLFKRSTLDRVVAAWADYPDEIHHPRRCGLIAAALGMPVHYHVPALVQHVGVSTWGCYEHRNPYFSADWPEAV